MSDFTWPGGGGHVTHRLRIDPSRSMKAVIDELEALLGDFEASSRRNAAFLASELIAQVVGRAPGRDSERVRLTIQLREDLIHLEATGPLAPALEPSADQAEVPADPLADWGRFIIDRLADRWGVGGTERQELWAEVEVRDLADRRQPRRLAG
jgi:hypothetical protein